MNVLVKVSGSISCFKICSLVSRLKQGGFNVKVAASASALQFVGAATWEGLSGHAVYTDDFDPGKRLEHIYLNDWADLVLLAPASAQTLNSLAKGVGHSVLTTLFLARKPDTPYWIFPAMNPRMWKSDSVGKSVDKLSKQMGIKIFNPNKGAMSCGHEGEGRLKEPDTIFSEILKYKNRNSKKILITFGGTSESIDGVREISNFSTGSTGLKLASDLSMTFCVTALGSESSLRHVNTELFSKSLTFKSYTDLESRLKEELNQHNYDMVIHLAAVSDYIPERIAESKIPSSQDNITMSFRKTPKLLNKLKDWSLNKKCKVVSFKLTHNQNQSEVDQKIKSQFDSSGSDFVVHNELSSSRGQNHEYTIFKSENPAVIHSKGSSKSELSQDLINIGRLSC